MEPYRSCDFSAGSGPPVPPHLVTIGYFFTPLVITLNTDRGPPIGLGEQGNNAIFSGGNNGDLGTLAYYNYIPFLSLSLYTARPSFEYYRQVYFVHSGLQDESLSKLP